MRPPINSKKHYVQTSLSTVSGGTAQVLQLVVAQEVPGSPDTEVAVGSVVKAIFIEMWIRSTEASPGTVLVSLIKTPDGQTVTFGDVVALNDYNNKKNVLYHTQGLTNDNNADAIPFIRQWFKIPKGKQRFGVGDQLRLVIASQAVIDNIICGFATYKEYT